ncbi:acyl-CoA/acyl-ACP dehydrogenase [Aneurinibacillus sp. Ricciae_BoGa-3]|uniref:acyl-CoA dehydrogenase family protein n=1 Tax=Aneurinibacillus sp. Ricciae_BoGa-3 TaxID=3022697 RepID=UPI002340DFB6|nr:acyl-CoA dehydrogenase family protein [Aneurinibacillus sp. Ricciae_BoGa-3]WCK55250.1 acyl-CoA/acyl-ACP dehydrogenase [Aneurinibacillus sp. Ricciae_BoGa-3]
MGRKEIDYFIRNEREAELAALADGLAERFKERAPIHDAEGSFPFENFEELKQSGYLKLTTPKEYGGEEISLYEMLLAQERIARGDGSTALAVGWHMGLMLNLRITRPWPEELFAKFCRDVVENGAMINSFASEPVTGSPTRGGKPATTAERTDSGWVITGRKTYSSLSPILDQFIVSASIAGEDKVAEFLIRKSDRVHIEETWNTLGMRATGSHDIILDHAEVPANAFIREFIPGKSKGDSRGNGWLLHIPACYLGIAVAARDFALNFVRSYRPNSLQKPIAELPHIQEKIGQMEAELKTARTLMYAVAARWDDNPGERGDLADELGLVKYTATNSAISIVDKAMRVVGGASLYRTYPLERMFRDVRAGLHNPPMDDAVIRNLALSALNEKK